MRRLRSDLIFDSTQLGKDLAGKSIHGGVSTMLSQGGRFIIRMASIMILARLLTPADFGLIGMVAVVLNFAQMFKDAGLSMATVQKDEITHELISTLFWANMFISIFFGGCLCLCAPFVSRFYGKPELTSIMIVLSLSFVISGSSIQHTAILQRHMQFWSLAFIQIIAQICTFVVAVGLAFFGFKYWALVGGALIASFASVCLTFFFCPWVPGWMQRRSGVRSMLVFGSHLTGFNFINYFSRNADNILIGRFIGADALGIYGKAYELFMLPITQIRAPIVNVMMPVLSSLYNQPRRYLKYYQKIVDLVATVSMPLAVYCYIEAEFLIRFVLGEQWLEAVPVFQIFSVAGFIQAVATTRGLVLLSHGYSKRYLFWGGINAVVCVGSFIVGIPYGIEGVAIAYTVANYLIFVPSLIYCFQKTPVTVFFFTKVLFVPSLLSIISGFIVVTVKFTWGYDTITAHFFYLSLFCVIYCGFSACRKSVRETSVMILAKLYS